MHRRFALVLSCLVALAGLASVDAEAEPGYVVTIPTGAGTAPHDLSSDLAGNIWFASGSRVGRLTGAAVAWVDASDTVTATAVAGDGSVWFATDHTIGQVHPDGTVFELTPPGGTASRIADLTTGPDGQLWYADTGTRAIGRVSPDGQFTEHQLGVCCLARQIIAGADGQIWFKAGTRVSSLDPLTGSITWFSPWFDGQISDITVGPDARIWAAHGTGTVSRLADDGSFTEIPVHTDFWPWVMGLRDLATGPDGNLWFVSGGYVGWMFPDGNIGQIYYGPDDAHHSLVSAGERGLYFAAGDGIGWVHPATWAASIERDPERAVRALQGQADATESQLNELRAELEDALPDPAAEVEGGQLVYAYWVDGDEIWLALAARVISAGTDPEVWEVALVAYCQRIDGTCSITPENVREVEQLDGVFLIDSIGQTATVDLRVEDCRLTLSTEASDELGPNSPEVSPSVDELIDQATDGRLQAQMAPGGSSRPATGTGSPCAEVVGSADTYAASTTSLFGVDVTPDA